MRVPTIVILALLGLLALDGARGDVHEDVDMHNNGDYESTPPVRVVPASIPYYTTGVALLDEVMIVPVSQAFRIVKAGFRGTLQCVRDLLFQQYLLPPSERKDRSAMDDALEDEGLDDFSRRTHIRDILISFAKEYGVIEFAKTKQEYFRYGTAIVFGLIMLGGVLLVQALGARCSRACLMLIFKVSGNEAWLDEQDLFTRLTADAAQQKKAT